MVEALPVFGEPAAAAEPGEGALDDPAFGQNEEKSAMPKVFERSGLQMSTRREGPAIHVTLTDT